MEAYKRGRQWWVTFYEGGKRYRLPTGAVNKDDAGTTGRELRRRIQAGTARKPDEKTPRKLRAAIERYLANLKARRNPRTEEFARERLVMVFAYFGDVDLADISSDEIILFQNVRLTGKLSDSDRIRLSAADRQRLSRIVAKRTIDMDVSALLRVLSSCKRLGTLRDDLKGYHPMDGSTGEIGRALTVEELDRLVAASAANPDWDYLHCAAVLASNTTMCSVEIRRLRRRDVDFEKQQVFIRYGKNQHRLRILPLEGDALTAVTRMIHRLDKLGFQSPDHYLWCACRWNRFDPSKPMKGWGTAWRALRKQVNLSGIRFHDLRHTMVTDLSETLSELGVIQSIAGLVSPKMINHYSHVRDAAKRQAFRAVAEYRELRRREAKTGSSN